MTRKQENQISAEILIVEDEVAHAEAIKEGLSRLGHNCDIVHDGKSAVNFLKTKNFDIIITDLMLGPNDSGLDVLAQAVKNSPSTKVILVTAHSSVDTCRQALQQGAFDYIEKPLDLDELRAVVSKASELTAQKRTIRELKRQLDEKFGFEKIVGNSAEMMRILQTVQRIAPTDMPVLLLGESGTGKELLANAIHINSRRSEGRFVAINCAGLSESLLEDELFGHVKGSYTGATTDRAGRFEHADGGTLFLDEIGDMPLAMQAKLLRVLENGEVVRVGSNEPVKVNVRIISATNANLEQKVADKDFREDLYFRVKGVTLQIPPLRNRRDDIPLLVDTFIAEANKKHSTNVKGIEKDAARILMNYPWPGNVRQLRNTVENMVILTAGDRLAIDDLPAEFNSRNASQSEGLDQLAGISLEQAEKELIRNTLKMVDGNREQASQLLGIGERTLYRKIKEYDLKDA